MCEDDQNVVVTKFHFIWSSDLPVTNMDVIIMGEESLENAGSPIEGGGAMEESPLGLYTKRGALLIKLLKICLLIACCVKVISVVTTFKNSLGILIPRT